MVTMALLGSALLASGNAALGNAAVAQDEAQLFGNWTGESICQVQSSPCHDEHVIYHISKGQTAGQVSVSADKIVAGKPVNMGTGDYTYDRDSGTLLQENAGRVWKLMVKGNTMTGTLTLPDKTIYRRVTLKKEE